MAKKIKIIECADQLGLGGTEYALQLYCKYLDKEKFDVTAIGLYKGGERAKLIQDFGIETFNLNGDFDKLEEITKDADVLHWHGYGEINPQLYQSLSKNKSLLILQTNVFGHFKESPYDDMMSYDLYISEMILARRMMLDGGMGNKYAHKRKVLPYPVDIDFLKSVEPDETVVSAFKKANQLDGYFVVGRIGRADDHKFDLITFDGFKEFLKYNSNARFLLIGATANMRAYIKKLGIENNVIILENTIDIKQLLTYYKAMDVFLAASNIGESFGMVMAEAMCMGVPVVTISTPDRDNAQIEVVDNQVTGFATYRLKETIAASINEIYIDPAKAKAMGKASIDKIANAYRAQDIVHSIEQLIFEKLGISYQKKKYLILDWSEKLKEDYKRRCEYLFGNPSFTGKLLVYYRRTIAYKIYKKIRKSLA